jgi:hypothetical protein
MSLTIVIPRILSKFNEEKVRDIINMFFYYHGEKSSGPELVQKITMYPRQDWKTGVDFWKVEVVLDRELAYYQALSPYSAAPAIVDAADAIKDFLDNITSGQEARIYYQEGGGHARRPPNTWFWKCYLFDPDFNRRRVILPNNVLSTSSFSTNPDDYELRDACLSAEIDHEMEEVVNTIENSSLPVLDHHPEVEHTITMSAEEVMEMGLRQAEAKGEVIYISDDSDQDSNQDTTESMDFQDVKAAVASGHVTLRREAVRIARQWDMEQKKLAGEIQEIQEKIHEREVLQEYAEKEFQEKIHENAQKISALDKEIAEIDRQAEVRAEEAKQDEWRHILDTYTQIRPIMESLSQSNTAATEDEGDELLSHPNVVVVANTTNARKIASAIVADATRLQDSATERFDTIPPSDNRLDNHMTAICNHLKHFDWHSVKNDVEKVYSLKQQFEKSYHSVKDHLNALQNYTSAKIEKLERNHENKFHHKRTS